MGKRTPSGGFKVWLVGLLAAWLIRVVCWTLRIRVEDPGGILKMAPDGPMIWLIWHNRIFVMPYIYRKYLRKRRGAVLTSASGDGEVIARVMARFGVDAVRGSSSRRGKEALREMVDRVGKGEDLVITPDGPRGPKYVLQAGAVMLAQATGARIFPTYAEFEKAWRLRSWDGFHIPKPFSRVKVTLGELVAVEMGGTPEGIERERLRVEAVMREGIPAEEIG